jgi:hypothetical protein
MTDALIIRLVDETSKVLARMEFFQSCDHLIPSYNALVQAAQANHPNDPYLQTAFPVLQPGEDKGRHEKHEHGKEVSPPLLRVLFTQLRIILEAMQEPEIAPAGYSPESRRAENVDIYREMYRAEDKEPTREREREGE